jgi:hypothetical protein
MSEHEPFGFDDAFGHDSHDPGFEHDTGDSAFGHDDALLGGDHDTHPLTDDDHWQHEPAGDHSTVDADAHDLPDSLEEHVAEPAGDEAYPPHLDVAITPTDGQEWVDPNLLGDDHLEAEPVSHLASSEELLGSLHESSGSDGEPSWEAAHNSDDPAVRSLAAFWHPEG